MTPQKTPVDRPEDGDSTVLDVCRIRVLRRLCGWRMSENDGAVMGVRWRKLSSSSHVSGHIRKVAMFLEPLASESGSWHLQQVRFGYLSSISQ